MAVPCHHWPDMLQFLDSPVTDVHFNVSGLGPGSEPPAMGDTPVLLEGWRVYEHTMVQRKRATLSAGRTRPPHEVFIPRACYQICRMTSRQVVMIAVCALVNKPS
ncbi:hypothetical protein CSKR_102001 [Clonorchis sinensis]|uniref:Uncharacterized protein n=1 Tax=Clonorchis sinensis TaxID=79923 RepID=A0A3R7CIX2_CLOSI|nr:hypothetical protein CSKR_102001 [Clonorchis sinensis]